MPQRRTKLNPFRPHSRYRRAPRINGRGTNPKLAAATVIQPPLAAVVGSVEVALADDALVGGLTDWLYCSWSLSIDSSATPREPTRTCDPASLDRSWMRAWFERELPYYLQSKLDADDLVQDACIRAWRHISQFMGDTAERHHHWLMSICRTCLIARINEYTTPCRDARRESRWEDEALASGDHPAGGAPGYDEGGIEAIDWADELEVLLTGFSSRTRQVVVWHALESRTLPEIAAELGCSVRTVERDWRHAREILRRRVLARET